MHNKGRKADLKDFLFLSSQFDNQPFDWENLNKNSLNSLLQMVCLLKIQVNFHHVRKKDVIKIIETSPKFPGSQRNIGFPPDYFETRLNNFNYMAIIHPKIPQPQPPPPEPPDPIEIEPKETENDPIIQKKYLFFKNLLLLQIKSQEIL